MATKKPAKIQIGEFDLEAFRKQRDAIQAAAYAEVSARVEQIRTLLTEVKEITEATGVEADLYNLRSELSDMVDSNWNSSGC